MEHLKEGKKINTYKPSGSERGGFRKRGRKVGIVTNWITVRYLCSGITINKYFLYHNIEWVTISIQALSALISFYFALITIRTKHGFFLSKTRQKTCTLSQKSTNHLPVIRHVPLYFLLFVLPCHDSQNMDWVIAKMLVKCLPKRESILNCYLLLISVMLLYWLLPIYISEHGSI